MELHLEQLEQISILTFVLGLLVAFIGVVWFRVGIMFLGAFIAFGAMFLANEVAAKLEYARCGPGTVKMINAEDGTVLCYPEDLARLLPLAEADGK